jgi:shikimate dehydrogenase
LCDDVDEKSIVAGAVNSVICRQGKILGRNVDGEGLVAALEASTDHRAAGTHVVVVGGGGAARSCVASLVSHDAVVTVMTRRPAERAGWNDGAILTSDMRIPSTSEWVINATNSTLKGEGLDLLDLGPDHALAVDLSYGRPSRFLEECATRGWATLDGLPMLYFQAKLQFEWWFEQELDVEVLGWHA